jgi:hypothetical protein
MPSAKAAILIAADKITTLADDLAAGRVPADGKAIEAMARSFASALRALASQYHS